VVWDRVFDPFKAEQARQDLRLAVSGKVAIVAALEREVRPLIKHWRVVEREHDGRKFRFFENGNAVLVCGGIGPDAARRATEAVIELYGPAEVVSAGFAGAVDSALKVGAIFVPARVVDSQDGSSAETYTGRGVIVSCATMAGSEQKAKLASVFGAQAVDMEAAAVARGAQARGVRFLAVKAISDENDFSLPRMHRFVSPDGKFRTAAFVASVAAQPWIWLGVIRLAQNASRASHALCHRLEQCRGSTLGGNASDLQPAVSGEP
jgi:adenosylhomocysteine nucleosidase